MIRYNLQFMDYNNLFLFTMYVSGATSTFTAASTPTQTTTITTTTTGSGNLMPLMRF